MFVFNQHFGKSTITDFDVNNAAIRISKAVSASATDLFNHTADRASGAIIAASATDQITLVDATPSAVRRSERRACSDGTVRECRSAALSAAVATPTVTAVSASPTNSHWASDSTGHNWGNSCLYGRCGAAAPAL